MTDRHRMVQHAAFLVSAAWSDAPDVKPAIAPGTAFQAARAWRLTWEASGRRMPVPDVCTGPDGQVFCSWDAGRHHLELEIVPGESPYWFWSDRETGETGSSDWVIGEPIPPAVIAALELFLEPDDVPVLEVAQR